MIGLLLDVVEEGDLIDALAAWTDGTEAIE